jgi:hypothetical protein
MRPSTSRIWSTIWSLPKAMRLDDDLDRARRHRRRLGRRVRTGRSTSAASSRTTRGLLEADAIVLASGDIPGSVRPAHQLKRARDDRQYTEEPASAASGVRAQLRPTHPPTPWPSSVERPASPAPGVQTVYSPTDVGRVSRLLHGQRPKRHRGVARDAADDESAVVDGGVIVRGRSSTPDPRA